MFIRTLMAAGFICILFFSSLYAQNTVTPGAIELPYPTITNLAVQWLITGDANNNSAVAVKFRKQGDTPWHDAMTLRRVPAGSPSDGGYPSSWPNKHSGSIFNLRPGTTYEINLVMTDADNGAGWSKDTTVTVATRPVPKITGACTIIECPDGNNGALNITQSGTSASPRVYRSTTGRAVYSSITMGDVDWVWLEGLVVRNNDAGDNGPGAAITICAGSNHINRNCVVRRCSVFTTGSEQDAITGWYWNKPGLVNCYIADNYVSGPVQWSGASMGASGSGLGEGIVIGGRGNVITNNYVKGYHDCLSQLEDGCVSDSFQICNDWLNNEVIAGLDDGIEADFSYHNCRIMKNRFTNCFNVMSSQPGLGGPNYFIRNAVYNSGMGAFKFNRGSIGDVVLHNSIIKGGDGLCTFDGSPFDYAFFRNNLALGGTNGGWTGSQVSGGYGPGSGYAMFIQSTGSHCGYDYDAVGTYKTTFNTYINGQAITAVEPHYVRIDSSTFTNWGSGLGFPYVPTSYAPQDLRIAAGSAAEDAALLIPNINDDFLGAGPDMGAYEAGQMLPCYGPRPAGYDEDNDSLLTTSALPSVAMTRSKTVPGISYKILNGKIAVDLGSLVNRNIEIALFNVAGEKVKTLYSGHVTSEKKTAVWNGKSSTGQCLPNGIYFLQLKRDGTMFTQRMAYLR